MRFLNRILPRDIIAPLAINIVRIQFGMTDVETQASQRTVIAFISGLLIGGLLVWMFSGNPEDTKKVDEAGSTDSEQVEENSTQTETNESSPVAGGDLEVPNQDAGMSVALNGTSYPEGKGWVVIRDYRDGMSGGILGAARYDTALNLKPTTVPLLRATVAGGSYEAVFYTDAGGMTFDLSEDMPVAGSNVMFTAN